MLHSRGYCSLAAEISSFVKKRKTGLWELLRTKFSPNHVVRKQTLGKAFFFFFSFLSSMKSVVLLGKVIDEQWLDGICWRTELKVTFYLPTAKSEKATQGRLERTLCFQLFITSLNLPLEIGVLIGLIVFMLLKFSPTSYNHFSMLSFFPDVSQLLYLIIIS